jgi:diguanylate cyclase (GGDEF)-like protein/PAS domain S-box-containing protein
MVGDAERIPRTQGSDPASSAADLAASAREAEERFRLAFEQAAVGMALVAPEGRFLRVNRALCELVGYEAGALVAMTFQEITHPADLDLDLEYVRQMLAGDRRAYAMEKRYFHADGHTVWVLLSVSLVRDEAGEPLYFISQIQDISERKQLEDRLVFLAGHDEMTGLPNRRRFREELEQVVGYAKRYGQTGALLLLDLDNFKQVNDTLGHRAGDRLVTEVASRLRGRVRTSDLLARIGGDEFAVFLPQATPSQAERVAGDLVATVGTDCYLVDEAAVETRASLGVALFKPDWETDPEALFMHADLAMYRAKREGGNRYVVVEARGRPRTDR